LSVAVPMTDWLAPCVDTVTGLVQESMPDPPSAQAKLTVTGSLFQPAAFAAGCRAPPIVGLVVSTRIVVVLSAPAEFSALPALSVLQNVTVCTPSSPSVNGLV